MDSRKEKVLHAIIQDYINTAEPVGSRTIARKYNLGVSPATIRNEMSDLEELGYIEQPHTSAGRIPSERGYRYYVDWLMDKVRLSPMEEKAIWEGYANQAREMEAIVHQTSKILSQITNLTSVVLGPQLARSVFKHIQLIPLEPDKALVVVVTEAGLVENRIIDIPPALGEEDLNRISRVLNNRLKGLTLEGIKSHILREIYDDLARQRRLLNQAVDFLEQCLSLEGEEKVYLVGASNMLSQPEFRDVEKVRTLLGALEEEKILRETLQKSREEGVTVRIGGENDCPGFRDCSMVTATYHIGGETMGVIGLVGPIRMDYSKAVSIVEFMTATLSEVLNKSFSR